MRPLLVRTLLGERVERFPVWLMRQAGRYLPGYRAVREKTPFLDLCRTPDLAAEVSLEPVERFDVDAAIVFADILLTLDAMGLEVRFGPDGPVLPSPVRSRADVRRLHPPDAKRVEAVPRTVALLRRTLPAEKAVIGFSAAPFTLAAYAIEGGTGRDFEKTRAFAAEDPQAFALLLDRCADALVPYLREQSRAGADVLQLFDTWAGVVEAERYRREVVPAAARVVEGLGRDRPPVIYFAGLGTEARLLDALASGADAISVDWRTDLRRAHETVGTRARLQGNLDPAVLLAPADRVREATRAMLEQVPAGRPHVANVGHGVLPRTPVENVAAFVETVRAFQPVGAGR